MDNKEIERRIEKTYESLRLLGRSSTSIYRVLGGELKSALGKTMMVKTTHAAKKDEYVTATTRTKHYVNAALIAWQIAEIIFPGDKDLQKGIALCTLVHDFGQNPFGHDFEEAMKKASKNYNGGPVPHGSIGARRLKYREAKNLEYAMNVESILEEEAIKRLEIQFPNGHIPHFQKKVTEEIKKLQTALNQRLEPELQARIDGNIEKNKELTERAIELLVMSAGNHNGERGTANIVPDYSITYEQFWKNVEGTFVHESNNSKLQVCTIADGIAKLSDQISSIVFDMIDGKRSKMEDEISQVWVKPVSKILQTTEEKASKRLKGDDKELALLALEIQDKFIEDVGNNSNPMEIHMSLDKLLYGFSGITGLRTPNFNEHTQYTSSKEEEIILNNIAIKLTDILSKSILNDNGVFATKLNAIFRMKQNNPMREIQENNLKEEFDGNESLRKFYDYVVETSSEEYEDYKRRVKEHEMRYFRSIIEEALKNYNNGIYTIPRREDDIMKYAVEVAFASGQIDMMDAKEEDGKYTDETIRTIIERVNSYLRANPVDNVINNLNVTVEKTMYDKNKKIIEKQTIGSDEQIAAQMAISYMQLLNDMDLLNFAFDLGIINEEEKEKFLVPYDVFSLKREGKKGHRTASMEEARKAYAAAQDDNERR